MDPQLQSEPVQQPVTPPPPTPTSSELPKILLIVIALIVIVGIGFGVYTLGINKGKSAMQQEQRQQVAEVLTPAPLPSEVLTKEGDPTSNWKTYINTQLRISLKYPTAWTTKPYEIESSYVHGIIALDPQNQKSNSLPGAITLSYWDNPDKISLEKLDKKYTGEAGLSPGLYSPTDEKVVGPVGPVLYRPNVSCEPFPCDRFLIPYKDKVYELTSFYNSTVDPNRESQKEVLNQILSTFKFIQ